ncbi:MAG: M20/M25/M40 family metallo-hydrolase [Gemmatimonadetes bacterium]|nr:M20/M25/M40 family metallo-hydrolase [Gemmatimonadota bacterium]
MVGPRSAPRSGDGYLYGRGAIDDKGMLACNLMAMLLVRRAIVATGTLPTRDVILLATSDEDPGDLRDRLGPGAPARPGGGRVRPQRRGRVRSSTGALYAAVQCAEKVPTTGSSRRAAPAGTRAVPTGQRDHPPDTAIAHHGPRGAARPRRGDAAVLRCAVARLARRHAAPRQGRRCIWRPGARGHGRTYPVGDTVDERGAAQRHLPTLISGGTRSNVIPTEAEATLNIRTLPATRSRM